MGGWSFQHTCVRVVTVVVGLLGRRYRCVCRGLRKAGGEAGKCRTNPWKIKFCMVWCKQYSCSPSTFPLVSYTDFILTQRTLLPVACSHASSHQRFSQVALNFMVTPQRYWLTANTSTALDEAFCLSNPNINKHQM